MSAPSLSAYERARLQQIARNQLEIERIGLASSRRRARQQAKLAAKLQNSASDATPGISTVRKTRKRKTRESVTKNGVTKKSPPLRRSKRQRGAKAVDYTKEKIDTSTEPQTKQEIKEQYQKYKKKQTADVLAESAAWLARHKESLIQRNVNAAKSKLLPTSNQREWRRIAQERWGNGVYMAETSASGQSNATVDWETYVLSRTSTPAPRGGGLLQENYMDCPWRLLISCVLMSRVSSAKVKTQAIEGFFDKFPTPTSVLKSKPSDIFDIIKPLGLFPSRHRSVVEVSTRFLTMSEPFDVGLQPELKIYGIGAFGVDSFNIFCRNQAVNTNPQDKSLAGYCRWVKSNHGK